MNKTSIALALAAIVSVGLSTPLWAESPATNTGQAVEPGAAPQMDQQQQSTAAAINPEDYNGKEVVTAESETVGKVDKQVVSNSDHAIYAVVGMGGVMGIGEKDAAIPISELQKEGDKLMLSSGVTKESLKSGMMYQESEFSAFEPMEHSPAPGSEGTEGQTPSDQ